MLEYIALLTVAIFAALSMRNWEHGLWLCILTGFAQDPVRKIIYSQPAYMVALVAVVFMATAFGLLLRRYRFNPTVMPGWSRGVSQALLCLILVVLLQVVNSWVRFQSIGMVGIGGMIYLAPIFALFTGFYFACRFGQRGVERLLTFYAVLCLAWASGIYLEYFGVENSLLGEVGVGLTIYDLGTVLDPFSGLFRSTEVAAWHIFFGSSCLVILAVRSPSIPRRWLWIGCLVFLAAAGVLTGRRKVVVTIIIFLSCYWLFLLIFINRAFRLAAVVMLLMVTSLWLASRTGVIEERNQVVYDLYIERATSVFGDIGARAKAFGVDFVVSAVRKHGLFGNGVGTASQGARFTSGYQGRAWEAEAGLGRIVVEIGLVGLVVLMWLVIALVGNVWKIMKYLGLKRANYATLCYGLVSVLVANSAHFVVAAQAFGDPFIVILLGAVLGFILASPVVTYLEEKHEEKHYEHYHRSSIVY